MSHIIRLRGPWLGERLDVPPDARPTYRLSMPGEWSETLAAEGAHVRLSRKFHRPSGLDDDSRIELVIETLTWPMTLALNDHPLGRCHSEETPCRFDISQYLAEENELRLETLKPLAAGQPGALGLVYLEIHE